MDMNSAGQWRRNAIGETSRQAAEAVKPTLRWKTLEVIERRPASPEMILAALQAEGVKTVLTSIRPRCSELARMGLIKDSKERGKAEGGKRSIIWAATSPEERSLWAAQQAAAAEHAEHPHG